MGGDPATTQTRSLMAKRRVWIVQLCRRYFLCRPLARSVNPADAVITVGWWLELIAGVLMHAVAFWRSGQCFIEKACTLHVFAGVWALLHGVTGIVGGAFRLRSLRRVP